MHNSTVVFKKSSNTAVLFLFTFRICFSFFVINMYLLIFQQRQEKKERHLKKKKELVWDGKVQDRRKGKAGENI